jgi:hypothetical protein
LQPFFLCYVKDSMNTQPKNETHKSRIHKGFEKQCIRQDNKPSDVKIKLPIAIKLPKNFKGKYKHHFTVSNSKWNGMNLKCLRNSFNILRVGGMYGKFTIDTTNGKYKLSMHGKSLLKKRRVKDLNKRLK